MTLSTASYLFFIIACLLGHAKGFIPVHRGSINRNPSLIARTMDASAIQEIEAARTAFVLCFFGAVGSAAVGREAIPVTLREWKKTNDLRGKGKTLGGAEIELFGYPEPVYTNDVMSVLSNNMTVFEMMEAYPVEGAIPGYLRYESLAQANAEASQMAVRAVFDAVAMGINKNQVAPSTAERKMELFKQDLDLMRQDSRITKTVGVTALVVLLTILGVADFFTIFHLWHGWFPEWEGFSNMPASLFDERGFSNLAACFVGDVPTPDVVSADAFPMS